MNNLLNLNKYFRSTAFVFIVPMLIALVHVTGISAQEDPKRMGFTPDQSIYALNSKNVASGDLNGEGYIDGSVTNSNKNDLGLQIGFSTYLGGNMHDWIDDLCIDQNGNVYVTGSAYSTNFPVTAGNLMDDHAGGDCDIFIAKFSKNGELIFSTRLGGNNYDGNSQIALDHDGNIIIAGVTSSTDFPTTEHAFDKTYNGDLDIFISKINSDCDSIIYSTYLGGIDQDHHPMMVVDDSGHVYISGPTRSSDFPTTDNACDNSYNGTSADGYYGDIFICKLDENGEGLLYASFVGGESEETVFGIDIDEKNIVYLTGLTKSVDFPASHQIFGANNDGDPLSTENAFLMALDCQQGTLKFSTVFGGNGNEQGDEVFIDQHENIYIAGRTSSEDFPTTSNAFNEIYNGGGSEWKSGDIFVCKFDSSGKNLIYSTYIGGEGDEGWCDLTIDRHGNALVGGGTSSPDFPVTSRVIDSTSNGGDNAFVYRDVFFFMLDSSGSELLYSTFIGGTGDDNVFKLKIDEYGSVYIGGLSTSSDFPTTTQAFDRIYNGERDAFLLSLNPFLSTSLKDQQPNKLDKITLEQNYPNPFNSSTTIRYVLNEPSHSKLVIYDLLGQEIQMLQNGFQNTGDYSLTWNATDQKNTLVSSGIYFYSLQADDRILKKKMILTH